MPSPDAYVQPHHLWSYAQEEALIAISEQGADQCWRLIHDPERRAKRIAARYADLYFKSSEKSKGKLQLYWPALAAFVVKDIVEAFRYSRVEVLEGGIRNWWPSKLGAMAMTGASPYEHAIRVYVALAKGNLWLFEDIYPWLWFVREYGLRQDGSMNADLLRSHVAQRDASTLQKQSKQALQELPFGANWLGRVKASMVTDPVYAEAKTRFNAPVAWGGPEDGYGQTSANQNMAHWHVRKQMPKQNSTYQIPVGKYWDRFSEAFYVLDETRRELSRVAGDASAMTRLQKVAKFTVTQEMQAAYQIFVEEHAVTTESKRVSKQKEELVNIAKQEQLNVLQPLIYDDVMLQKTMDANHAFSRYSGAFLSPSYTVIYSFQAKTNDPNLQTVFDSPSGIKDWLSGPQKSLPNAEDRMDFVNQIAKDFNKLMDTLRAYMESELIKIRGWINA